MTPTLPTAMVCKIEGGGGARWVPKRTTCTDGVDWAGFADITVKLRHEISHAIVCSCLSRMSLTRPHFERACRLLLEGDDSHSSWSWRSHQVIASVQECQVHR